MIVNLGANACKYAGESGKIKVWARYDEANREVTIGVTDSGPGIAPEHVKLIFDRFQQVPSDKPGEGRLRPRPAHRERARPRQFRHAHRRERAQQGKHFRLHASRSSTSTSLIPLHFNFLKTSRHSFQNVAINLASVAAGSDGAALADVERLLNRQLRSYDLLLRLSAGNWLVCIACNEDEIAQVTERILGAYAQNNHNRPDGPLPDATFPPGRNMGARQSPRRPAATPSAASMR